MRPEVARCRPASTLRRVRSWRKLPCERTVDEETGFDPYPPLAGRKGRLNCRSAHRQARSPSRHRNADCPYRCHVGDNSEFGRTHYRRARFLLAQSYEFHRHSITSLADTSSIGGISIPSIFAVLRLITNSNVVGCWTGKSAGFSPLRMRPT
jgi:hypothetical protein